MKRMVLVALACSVVCSGVSAAIAVHIARKNTQGDFEAFELRMVQYFDGQLGTVDHRLDGLRSRIEVLEDRRR